MGDEYITFVNGGWAGAIVGLSNVDGHDASENATMFYHVFKDDRWYEFRVRVRTDRVRVWIDGRLVISQDRPGHTLVLRSGSSPTKPLALFAWQSRSEIKAVTLRSLTVNDEDDDPAKMPALTSDERGDTDPQVPADND